jgi:MFS family permease
MQDDVRGADRTHPARMGNIIGDAVASARATFTPDRGLVVVGAAGLVVSLLCLIAVAVRGTFIPPEGKMLDATTFSFGVGIFALTIALLLPLAGYSEAARRRWRAAFYIFIVYGLVVAGIVFGVTAALNTTLFMILGLRFFRTDVLTDRPTLLLGIRYGVVAVVISFAVGVVMSVISGREVGEAGNLLLTHALGVHGIQFVPVVALLLLWAASGQGATRWLHAAGVGWLTACVAALGQALFGRPPMEVSMLTTVMFAGLAVWTAAAGYAMVSWRRAAARPLLGET